MRNTTRLSIVFKAMGNVNRLKIVELLSSKGPMHVGDIAAALKISFTATSNNLVLLQKLDVLIADGKRGHVYYSINSRMPQDFMRVTRLILT